MLGCSKFHVWDHVLCQPENTTDQFGRICDFWPVWYGDQSSSRSIRVQIQFQINHFCFSEKYTHFFIHRQGAANYKAQGSDGGGGGVLPSPYLDQKLQ